MSKWPTKRERAEETVQLVLVAAVSSVLVTRLFIQLSNQFSLGGGDWHLAHVLWGGLAMFIGGFAPMLFYGNKVRTWSGIFFGIGAGLFIDEVGKFVTKDNNYFFQPAIIFIWAFFVTLFLLYRYLTRFEQKDPKSLFYRVLGQMEEIAEDDLEISEKEKLMERMNEVASRSRQGLRMFSTELGVLIGKLPARKNRGDNKLMVWFKKLKQFSYNYVFKKKVVLYLLLILAVGDIVTSLVSMGQLLWWRNSGQSIASIIQLEVLYPRFDSYMVVGKMITDGLASGLFLIGLFWIVQKKFRLGLVFFQNGLLINIFLVSLFNFYFEQFSAVIGLSLNIGLYLGISRLRRDFVV